MEELTKANKEFVAITLGVHDSIQKMQQAADREFALLKTPDSLKGAVSAGFVMEDRLANIDAEKKKVAEKINELQGKKAGIMLSIGGNEPAFNAKYEAALANLNWRGERANAAYDNPVPLSVINKVTALKQQKEELDGVNRALQAEIESQTKLGKEVDAAAAAVKRAAGEAVWQDGLKAAQEYFKTLDVWGGVKGFLGFGEKTPKALIESKVMNEWRQLPNPRLQAEELRGAKTVTTADVPQPFVEIQRSEAATAQNTARIAAGIEKLVSQGNRADSSVNQVATLSLP